MLSRTPIISPKTTSTFLEVVIRSDQFLITSISAVTY